MKPYLLLCIISLLESLGGLDVVKNDTDKIRYISEIYKVEERLVQIRINNLFPENFSKSTKEKSKKLGLFKKIFQKKIAI